MSTTPTCKTLSKVGIMNVVSPQALQSPATILCLCPELGWKEFFFSSLVRGHFFITELQGDLKGDFKSGMFTAYSCIFYLRIPDITCKIFGNISQTIIYIPGRTLDQHLNLTGVQIPHEAGQLILQCNPLGGKPETHTLHSTGKHNIFSDCTHNSNNTKARSQKCHIKFKTVQKWDKSVIISKCLKK